MLRILILAALVAIAVVVVWLVSERDARVVRESGSERLESEPISPALSNARSPALREQLPPPLRLHSSANPGEMREIAKVVPVATSDSLVQAFKRDEPNQEVGAKRLEQVRDLVNNLVERGIGEARIMSLECRSHYCKLRLAGNDAAKLLRTADALQDDRGFLGHVRSLMLTREEDDLVFYLHF